MAYEDNQPKNQEASIALVAERISNLHTDLTDLKQSLEKSMDKVTEAVTKLVLVEERQSVMNNNYDRVVQQLEKSEQKYNKLEERVDAIEKEQPIQKQISKWVIAAVTAIVGLACTMILKQLGFM